MAFQPDDILCLKQRTAGLDPGWYLFFHGDANTALLAVTVLEHSGEVNVTGRMVRVAARELAAFRLVGSLARAERS